MTTGMKLLLLKTKYIGDTLLLAGTARAIRRAMPDAEIHVLVAKGTEGILTGCPEIARIHTVITRRGAGLGEKTSDLAKVIRRLRAEKFDHAICLTGSRRTLFITALSGARKRSANSSWIRSRLIGAMLPDSMKIEFPPPSYATQWDSEIAAGALGLRLEDTRPVFEKTRADFTFVHSSGLGKDRPLLFIHPTASLAAKMWPETRWSELLAPLASDFDILLSCGPAPEEIAFCERIVAGMPDAGRVRLTRGAISWAAMAGALYSAGAYLGADTSAMHLAGACGIPVLGVFGNNSREHIAYWAPPGDAVRIVTYEAGEQGIADIPVARVREALRSLPIFAKKAS